MAGWHLNTALVFGAFGCEYVFFNTHIMTILKISYTVYRRRLDQHFHSNLALTSTTALKIDKTAASNKID